MGVFLDSSVIIRSERLHHSEREMLENIIRTCGVQDIGISSIVVTEILHGIYRAKTDSIRERRREFIQQVLQDVPVYPYTHDIAKIAGRIGGEQAALANTTPFTDLLIGSTAIFHGYSLLTTNVRHFRIIPGLKVIAF